MGRFLTVLALYLFGLSSVVQAEKVYRWVDENGQTHFSSQAPRTLDDDVYHFRVDKAASSSQNKTTTTPSATEKKTAAAATSAESEEQSSGIDPDKAKEYCRQAKESRQKLSENFNRRYLQDDGSARPLTDKERASMIKQAEAAIASYCQKK